ncbi:SAM-dependent methyltransferase [Nitratiruptor tergarcus]|uniref:SAM-dependent methyltransferase, MidA family n=1 Tax=Nitratiruptor tergarcus DSM 16512 TaxID=1069081 RepID=A0A1W1WU45_9BACT|nr:SAM-dependent methyltransferase [Nitratiruptor tergarcus]SMC09844.1 SAM-dependent methyltransferase, MidA family [Nitratiruptor tergarcus DSM 16512]
MKKFSEFMHEWLYAKDGYYANQMQIGKSGDFFTSVSVTPLFGGAIAKYIYSHIQEGKLSPTATIMEIGAHQGYLLADIIQFLYTFEPNLINTLQFAIVEPIEKLRNLQSKYMQESFGYAIKFRHYTSLDEVKQKEAFVVANEIFDAFGCELLFKGKQAYVNSEFQIEWKEADPNILALAKEFGQIKGEIAIGYEEFAQKMFNAFEKIDFITCDYGDLEVRNDFSIRVYTKHQVYPFFDEKLDIKKVYKRSDITYDVNFSHLKKAFSEAGFEIVSYKTQLAALVEFGIMDLLEEILERKGYELYKQELEKVKILISPSQMGERFKMIHFAKR